MFFLSGCIAAALPGITNFALAGASGGKSQSAADQGILKLTEPIPSTIDFPDMTKAVGMALGFEVHEIDRETNMVFLTCQTHGFLGRYSHASVRIKLSEDRKTVSISVNKTGNVGEEGQKAVEKIIADFKERLAKQLQPT